MWDRVQFYREKSFGPVLLGENRTEKQTNSEIDIVRSVSNHASPYIIYHFEDLQICNIYVCAWERERERERGGDELVRLIFLSPKNSFLIRTRS